MPIEPIISQMRRAICAHLPAGAFLKRDRGGALLITNAKTIDPDFAAVPDFSAEARGNLIALTPEDRWIYAFERDHAPIGHLSASLARFRGQAPARAAIDLFVRGLKLSECRPTDGEIADFDRAVRQMAAVSLRTGEGGGIYALAVLDEMLNLC